MVTRYVYTFRELYCVATGYQIYNVLSIGADGKQLASGGNDNKVIVWDAAKFSSNEGSVPRFVNTQHRAAVKALAWSPHRRNLLVSGGGTTDQTIRFWNTSSVSAAILSRASFSAR